MNLSLISLSLRFTLLFSFPSLGVESLVLTESQLAARVRQQNRDIGAARLLIDEAVGRMKNAGRLENPTLQMTPRVNATSRERGLEFNFSQKFPVTQRLKLDKDITVTEVKAAEWEVRERENQLIGEALSAFVRLTALRQRRELLQEQTKVAKDLAESLDDTVKKGEVSKIDAVQARIQAMRFRTQAASLDAEEQQALAVLNPLLGMDASKPIYVSGALSPIEIPGAGAVEKRPALQVARLEAVSADQTTALERANRLSDVSVGVVAGVERNLDVPVGFENERIIGLQLSIPLPLWNKNQGNIDAASAFAERKDKEHLAFRQKMLLEAQATRAEMLDWTKLVAVIETEMLPLAKEQCEMTEAAQRNGQAQWLDVFRCREQLLSTAISRLDAIENFHLARARYKTILGTH